MAQRSNKNVSGQNAARRKTAPAGSSAGSKTKSGTGGNRQNTGHGEHVEQNLADNPVFLNITPFILIIISIYILVSFFINGESVAKDVGGLGVFSRNMFYGLFGFVAVLVPICMGSIAFFFKRDIKSGFLKYRIIFSVTCLILYASMFHLASKESAEIGYAAGKIFENGKNSVGGGIFGGYLAETLRKCVGNIGAWIFTISLSVVFSTFLFGHTPAGVAKLIYKLVRDYKTSKNGFERNVIVKTRDPERMFKMKTRRYTIASQINMPRAGEPARPANTVNRRNFQADIPIETPKSRKKPAPAGISIAENPFADNTDTAEPTPVPQNTEPQRNYETPLMLPDKELFNAGDIKDVKSDTDNTDTNKNAGIEELFWETDEDAGVNFDAVSDPVNFENNAVENIKIVESAPQTRGDEPDIAEDSGKDKKSSPKTIEFETSGVFENDENKPLKKEYKLPPLTYLTKDTSTVNVDISEELNTTAKKLTDTLASFGVRTKIYGVSRGPSITRYEISPDSGIKVRSIVNLVDDISLNLATGGVRIEAPIPGKSAVGVEVPNKIVSTVHLRSLLEEQQFVNAASKITVALGMDVAGNAIYSDIAKMPHLLIAGATGMGKSVCINSIITSILYKATSDEVKLILIDPKKVELNIYNGIPHLLVPVVSDPKKAAGSLSWAVNEMENRFMLIEEKGVRDLKAYNESIEDDPLSAPLPQIVIIIDELADLMMTAPADVEQSICRLAQKARAAGMHLIIGTQRPSVDVITGLIKANIPSRIAFTVASQIDSRTIIDSGGAEKLIGRGDMLYLPVGSAKPMRVQGAYVSEKDVLNVTEFLKKQSDGEYDENILSEIELEAARCNTKGAKIKDSPESSGDEELEKEPMLKPAIEIAIDMGTVSTSLLQRKLSLGYARAARIVDKMEKMNIIGPFEGSKPRRVLITKQEFIEMTMNAE